MHYEIPTPHFVIFFGHVAYNKGDLAVNQGSVQLLNEAFPGCTIDIVLWNAGKHPNLIESLASLATGNVRFHPIQSALSGPLALDEVETFIEILESSSVPKVGVAVMASGEHLFHRQGNSQPALLRLAAMEYATRNDMPLLIFPSTLGPFDHSEVSQRVRVMLSESISVGVRDLKSYLTETAETPNSTGYSLIADPAFHLMKGLPAEDTGLSKDGSKSILVSLRFEGFGMRIGSAESAANLKTHRREDFKRSCSLMATEQALDELAKDPTYSNLQIVVQTRADREISVALEALARTRWPHLSVALMDSPSYNQWMQAISSADTLVSSRFHSLVLALAFGKKVIGIELDGLGHKISGLHGLVGVLRNPNWSDEVHPDLEKQGKRATCNTATFYDFPKLQESTLQRIRRESIEWLRQTAMLTGLFQSTVLSPHHESSPPPTMLGSLAPARIYERSDLLPNMWRGKWEPATPSRSHLRQGEHIKLKLVRATGLILQPRRLTQRIIAGRQRPELVDRETLERALQESHGTEYLDRLLSREHSTSAEALADVLASNLSVAYSRLAAELSLDSYLMVIRACLFSGQYEASLAFMRSLLLRYPFADFLRDKRQVRLMGLLARLSLLPPVQPRVSRARDGRVLYFVHNALPYSTGGYANRSHGIARGLATAGYEVVVISRTGFPTDVDIARTGSEQIIEGVSYVLSGQNLGRSSPDYFEACTRDFNDAIDRYRPEFAIGGSFAWSVGLPALTACRRRGVPFIYEVRGQHNLLLESKKHGLNRLLEWHVDRLAESVVARESQRIAVITPQIAEHLCTLGVRDQSPIDLPNGVDSSRFVPSQIRDLNALPNQIHRDDITISYIGSFVGYEGIDLLVIAFARLRMEMSNVRLLLVGADLEQAEKGSAARNVADLIASLGLQGFVSAPGRVSPDEIPGFYEQSTICVYPRLSDAVTEAVTPLKPLEAMASGILVVASRLAPMESMIQHGRTGLLFTPGSVDELLNALREAATRPDLRRELSSNAVEWVSKHRDWRQITRAFVQATQSQSIC